MDRLLTFMGSQPSERGTSVGAHFICQQLPFQLKNYISFNHNEGSQNFNSLTHWSQVTHMCVSKLTIIGSDNNLSQGRHWVIIWTNAVILLIWSLRTNFSEILVEIHVFSLKKNRLIDSELSNKFSIHSLINYLNSKLNWPMISLMDYWPALRAGLLFCNFFWSARKCL